MNRYHRTGGGALLPLLALSLIVASGGSAHAHAIGVFATAEGDTIVGNAYVAGGDPLPDAPVVITGLDDEVLGETRTDDEGEFSYRTDRVCDHTVTVDTGDGHIAFWVVRASELESVQDTDEFKPATGAPSTNRSPPGSAAPNAEALVADFEKAVERAVEKKIGPLRAQLSLYRGEIQKYESNVRVHDVIGGIGYILGLCGIAYYFMGARKGRRSQDTR